MKTLDVAHVMSFKGTLTIHRRFVYRNERFNHVFGIIAHGHNFCVLSLKTSLRAIRKIEMRYKLNNYVTLRTSYLYIDIFIHIIYILYT